MTPLLNMGPLCLCCLLTQVCLCMHCSRVSRYWGVGCVCRCPGTPSSSCCTPWGCRGSCWPFMLPCPSSRRLASIPSLCQTSTTSPLTTTPSSSSPWSPTFPVSWWDLPEGLWAFGAVVMHATCTDSFPFGVHTVLHRAQYEYGRTAMGSIH